MELSKKNLKGLIEPIVYDGIKEGNFKVSECAPLELLTWNRLDLGFKLFYLENLKKYTIVLRRMDLINTKLFFQLLILCQLLMAHIDWLQLSILIKTLVMLD